MKVIGQPYAPPAFPLQKIPRYALNMKLGRPQHQSGLLKKKYFLPLLGFETWIIQAVA